MEFMELIESPYALLTFLILFAVAVGLAIGVREIIDRRQKEKLRRLEARRRKALIEKMEGIKMKKVEMERERELEKRRRIEKERKRAEAKRLRMIKAEEERKRNEKKLSSWLIDLNRVYKMLLDIVNAKQLKEVTETYIWKNKLAISIEKERFEIHELSDKRLKSFLEGLASTYDDSLGEGVGNLFREGLKDSVSGEIKEVAEKLKRSAIGLSYVFEEPEPRKSYNFFTKYIQTTPGLCITRVFPNKIKRRLGENFKIIWLTKAESKESMDPTDLERLSQTVKEFVRGGEKVVMLDGLEYLITQNNYKTILRFVQTLTSMMASVGSMLIVPVNPSALNERQLALLEREMVVLK